MAPIRRRRSLGSRANHVASRQLRENIPVNPEDADARLANQRISLDDELRRVNSLIITRLERNLRETHRSLNETRRLYLRYQRRYLLACNRLQATQRDLSSLQSRFNDLVFFRDNYVYN